MEEVRDILSGNGLEVFFWGVFFLWRLIFVSKNIFVDYRESNVLVRGPKSDR